MNRPLIIKCKNCLKEYSEKEALDFCEFNNCFTAECPYCGKDTDVRKNE